MRNELDDAIVDLLVQNTRETHRRIAELTGIAESTARARVQSIIESGRIAPSVLVHPEIEEDGFIFMARMRLAEGVNARQLVDDESVATSPWIAQVSSTGEVIVQLSATTIDAMVESLERVRLLEGVVGLQSLVVLRIYVGASWDRNGEHEGQWAAKPTRGADAIDRALVVALRLDGRASYTALAELVGLTVAATRRRVLRLVEDGVIRFATRVLDDSRLGSEAAVDLSVPTSDLSAVIEELCAMESVRYVIEQTGEFNLACYVVADDTAGLARAVDRIVTEPRVAGSRTDPLIILRDRTSWTGSSY
jgi:DNA-binding Lrp family transcriptional regulator